jgi:hypothetical protein
MQEVSPEEEALLRAALRETSGDPEIDAFARGALLSAIAHSPALVSLAVSEVGPEQAELDVHLDGATVMDHTLRAAPFGVFVSRTAEVVKEMVKSRLGLRSLAPSLLISGASQGSVRAVFRAPDAPLVHDAALRDTSASTVDSDALRTLAIVFAQAGDGQVEALDATISELPAVARLKLRTAVNQLAANGWSLEGELRQRHVGVLAIQMAPDQALALGDRLRSSETTIERDVVMRGRIDGTRRYTGSMWFAPETASRPFAASVTDAELLERVNLLNASADAVVDATFDRVRTSREAADGTRVTTSYLLTAIQDVAPPPELDLP